MISGKVSALKDSVDSRKVVDEERSKGDVECSRLVAFVIALDAKFKWQDPLHNMCPYIINSGSALVRNLPEIVNTFDALGTGIENMESISDTFPNSTAGSFVLLPLGGYFSSAVSVTLSHERRNGFSSVSSRIGSKIVCC